MVLLKNQDRMTDDMLATIFCDVEGIVNSRPLTKVNDDVDDDTVLTPNHLLLLRGNPPLAWGNFDSADQYRKRWRQVQAISERFWKRWLKEYLPQLQLRQKWLKTNPNLKVGDIVLIVDENSPRGLWPMGLVISVSPGRDGLVCSAKIRTKSTTLVRPITKLVRLEEPKVV
jgi:hypothetical protein